MKIRSLLKYILYGNGYTTNDAIAPIVPVSLDNDTNLIFVDGDGTLWTANTGTTSPTLVDSNTTAITYSLYPTYIGGPSAYTFTTLKVLNNDLVDVTNECTFYSRNTQIASVTGKIVSGVYTGATAIVAYHPDQSGIWLTGASFTVGQIITAIYPRVGSLLIASGATYSMTYSDQWSNTIATTELEASYSDAVIDFAANGTITAHSTGTTTLTVNSEYTPLITTATTINVTIDGTLNIHVDPITAYIGGASAYTYQAVTRNEYGQDITSRPTYVSRDTAVATVGASTGLITGVNTGSTTIVATYAGYSATSNTFTVGNIITGITMKRDGVIVPNGATLTCISGSPSAELGITGLTFYDQSDRLLPYQTILGYNAMIWGLGSKTLTEDAGNIFKIGVSVSGTCTFAVADYNYFRETSIDPLPNPYANNYSGLTFTLTVI